MKIVEHFPYTGSEQRWLVPSGVTSALFECWGAAGGMPSRMAWRGTVRQVMGGSGPANNAFTNDPTHLGQLGATYANNAGYTAGTRAVTPGEQYYLYVGGNGGPGFSSIMLNTNGTTYSISVRGGVGGWNGGGNGGVGAHIYQNAYNSVNTVVQYIRDTLPVAAKAGQNWYDTGSHLVYHCTTTYHHGSASYSHWLLRTQSHIHGVGSSGGGGGGATDVRLNANTTAARVMVAGGSGGAGGHQNSWGNAAWVLQQVPLTPEPPFGADSTGTGASGPDSTWATAINYLSGGWGRGGMGGASGPTDTGAVTTEGGVASTGGTGGSATNRHADGFAVAAVPSSNGVGGSATAGGALGVSGLNGTAGALAQGGNGNDATGNYDDWCDGGGGGGGGWYGGGGGGMGFKVVGTNAQTGSHGGGGGGGSNYVGAEFTSPVLAGCARPPLAVGNAGTGANGLGGFARITYDRPPEVQWSSVPTSALAGSTFTAQFSFTPAVTNGAGIAFYVFGYGAVGSSFPSTQTTISVKNPDQTSFSQAFTAPASGVTSLLFLKVIDTDGDASAWLPQSITGLSTGATTAATITSPTAGSQYIDSATVDWTLGTQTPLAAYQLGLSGTTLDTGNVRSPHSAWRRGGSRVNLATDPGFKGTSVWSSTSNQAVVTNTAYPGVSGSNGKILWLTANDGSAENHTTAWNNLVPGTTYRLHIEVASGTANDLRQHQIQVWDANGVLTSSTFDTSALAAGAYFAQDIVFTPHTQGVYVTLTPSGAGIMGDPWISLDFEDATSDGFSGSYAVADETYANSGDYSLKVTGATSLDLSTVLPGAGHYVAEMWAFIPTSSSNTATLTIAGTGVTGSSVAGNNPTKNAWVLVRTPFTWDGTGTVTATPNTATGGHWWDDFDVYTMDPTNPQFGNADSSQYTYLANMVLELVYAEDATLGYQAYFDGSHTGTSWAGTTNASASFLTGTDVLTGTFAYTGPSLLDGSLTLTTLTEAAVVAGFTGVQASIDVAINPSLPAAPTVTLGVSNSTGTMTLGINASDGSATYPTVSFDIFRDGVRIATGLTPDATTRAASYTDFPGNGDTVTYVVRALDSEGGYTDQPDGTVTLLD